MDKKTRGIWIVIALGAIVFMLAALPVLLGPPGTPLNRVARWTGMTGYAFVFLAILSSAFMRALYRHLGRPFLWGHHVVSVAGLILIALHPIALAIETASAAVFVPRFDSWTVFFELGGRPALYLFAVASFGALMRKRWRQNWRLIHLLNYVAFVLGTVHAVLIGTDLGRPFLRLAPISMALVMMGVFAQKRMGQRRSKRKRR